MTENQGVSDAGQLQRTSREIADSYRRSSIRPNDIVVSIGPSYGKVMVVSEELDGANLTQGTARVAPAEGVDARFLYWSLQAAPAKEYWDASTSGATFRALNLEPLAGTPIPSPPLEEQRKIAAFLDREVANLKEMETKLRRQLELVAERQRALITAVVTGEMTVPDSVDQ